MRARLLKPGFFTNEALGALPLAARLLFAGLWCLADREGRLEDRPLRIKAEVFPYSKKVKIESFLDQLAQGRLIIRYEAGGEHYIWIPSFLKHQRPHPHESASILPPCPDGLTCNDKAHQ